MNVNELKNITENLIETTELAGNKSIELYSKGLKKLLNPITHQLQMEILRLIKYLPIK